MTHVKHIKPDALKALDTSKAVIIDVRTPMEHAEKHMNCAHVHIPLDVLNPTAFMAQRGLAKDAAVYILCRSGMRAVAAAEKFIKEGYDNAYVIEGGILACEAHGHEVKGA